MFGNATFGATKEAAYLNVFNGNLTLQDTDGFLANTGLNLAYTRTYNSQGNLGSGRGKGWSDGLARLDGAPASGAATVPTASLLPFTRTAGDGSVSSFTYDAARGAYVSTDGGGAYQTIRWSTTDSKWHWTGGRDDDKEMYEAYDASGRLAAAGDAGGVRNRYTYDTAGRLSTITSGTDVSTFTYGVLNTATNTRKTTVTQNLGAGSTVSTTYETDHLDRLVRVTTDLTPGNATDTLTYSVSYGYDGLSNRIASVTQADGSTMAVTYEGDKVKTITEHDNSGTPDRVTTFGHATVGALTVATVKDALGNTTTYTADAQGRLLTVEGPATDAVPLKLTFSYDTTAAHDGDVRSVTDATGRTTWFEYDSHGNNILQRDADGNTITRTYRPLDPANPAKGYTNELLTETLYAGRDPDGAGTLKASQPLTSRNVYYTAAGKTHLVRFAITAQGRVTEYTYNAAGERTNEWTYMGKAFDTAALGAEVAATETQVTAWITSSGAAAGLINRVDYAYTRGLITAATHYATAPASTGTATTGAALVSYTYDNAGNLLNTTDANRKATTIYTYDGLGRVVTRKDPNGTSTYTYLPNNTAMSTLEPSGVTTLRVYDSAGRVLSVTQSQGELSSVTKNVYDAAGRLRMAVAPGGQKTVWLYDGNGRKTAQVGPDGAVTEYIYTKDSGTQPARVVQYATTIATATLFAAGVPRDDLGIDDIRPLTTAFDRTAWQRYDALGRVIASVDPEGYLTRYDYDGAGRLVGTIRRATKVPETKLAAGITWDAAGDTVSSDDRTTRTLYNADGLVTAKVDALNFLTEYQYDAGGQLTDTIAYAVEAAKPAIVNSVADLRPSAAGAIRERMFYDGHGRLVATLDGDNYLTEISYDPNGNVLRRTRYATPSTQPAAATLALVKTGTSAGNVDNRSTSYTYTTLNQVETESVTNESGGVTGQVTTYSYDKFGNVLTAIRTSGSTATRNYDKLGRLVSESPAAGVPLTTYTYNSAGQRASMTDGNGNKTIYLYDDAGRVRFTVNGAGEVRQQFYDAFGQVKAVRQYLQRVVGVTEATTALTLLGMLQPQTTPTDLVTQYFYDKDGRLRYTVDAAGGVSETQYTAFGQAAATLRYTGKVAVSMAMSIVTIGAVGGTPLSALTALSAGTTGVGVRYTYDADGRVRYSVSSANEVQSYAYDAFDRVTESRARAVPGQLTGTNTGDSVQGYEYDGRGNVISYTDAQRNVTITGYNAFGQLATRSRAGLSLAGSAATVASVTERSYYNDDGKLVGTIDAAGVLTTLSYDTDGNVTQRLRYATALTAAQVASATAATLSGIVTAQAAKDADVRYFYAQGRLQSSATSDGTGWQITTFKYDGLGNVTAQRNFAKRMTGTPTASAINTWVAAAANASASDAIKTTVYDAAGRPEVTATLQSLVPGATAPLVGTWSVTTLTYDGAGRVLQRRDHAAVLSSAEPSSAELRGMAVSDKDGITRFQYDKAGRIAASAVLQSKDGDATAWAITTNDYDGAGNLVKKTQYGDAARNLAAGADLLTAATANAASDRVTRYAYDSANRLASTVDGMGTATAYEYDALGNLVLMRVYATPTATGTLPNVNDLDRVTRVAYDLNGRARFEIAANGAVTERRYDAFGNVTATIQYANTLASVPAGAKADTVAALVKTNAADRTERYAYDENGRLRFTVDAAGYMVEQRYDALGNRVSSHSYVTPVAMTDSTPLKTLFDAATAQGKVTDAALAPRVTIYTYDAQGRVLSVKDARLHTESYTYDALGRRLTLTNKVNHVWQYSYDAAGRLLQEESPAVNAYNTDSLTSIDAATALVATSTALVTKYVYDALGNLSSRSEGAKGSTTLRTTSYRYDLVGRQTETWLPPTAVYDAATDAAAREKRNETSVTDLHVTVTYDALGNAVKNVDTAGNTTYKTYDLAGCVRYETDALKYVTGYARNAFGEVNALTRYAGKLGTVDPSTMKTMEESLALRTNAADDRVIQTEYDKLGRAIKVTEPASSLFDSHSTTGTAALSAARTTVTRYTPFGEVAERSVYGTDGKGNPVTEAATTLYYYDERGDKRGQVDVVARSPQAKGYLSTFDYDAAGRLQRSTEWSTVIGAWNTTDSTWGASSVTAPGASAADRTTIYAYDANGNKTSERRIGTAVDATTSYTYDDLDRLTTTTDASGAKNITWYDKLGRTTGTARVKAGSTVNPYTEFRLDVYGAVAVRIDYANSVATTTTAGAVPAVTSDATRDRVTATKYDAAGRATTVIDAENKTVYYSYDKLGRVAKQWRTVTNGVYKETAFTITQYDALGRVTDVIQPGNNDLLTYPNGTLYGTMPADTTVHTDYNGFGEAITRTTSTGTTVLRTEVTRYDKAGHAWLSNAGDGVYKVTLFDVQGNATASLVSETTGALAGLTDASQALVRTDIRRTDTRYDLLGHVVDVSSPHANQLTFLHRQPDGSWVTAPYDPAGKELDGLVVLGDRAEYTNMNTAPEKLSTYSVRYRVQGTNTWVEAGGRVQRIDGYPVFNTGGLAQGTYEFRITVQPAAGSAYELDGGLLSVTAQASDQKLLQLIKLYSTLLGRAPDPAGLNFYLKNMAGGVTLAQTATAILDDTEKEFQNNVAASGAASPLAYILRNLGIREGDPAYAGELATWQARLDLKNIYTADNRGQAIVDLMLAKDAVLAPQADVLKEYLVNGGGDPVVGAQLRAAANIDRAAALQQATQAAAKERLAPQLARLYVAIFGRAADAGGFNFWRTALEAVPKPGELPTTPAGVAANFLGSPEFASLQPVGTLTTAQFNEQLVKRVYRNLVNRAPTATELSAALAAMGSTNDSRGQWVLQLTDKVAGYLGTDTAPLADRAVAYSRAAIGLAYAQMTPPSTDIATLTAIGHALLDEAVGEPNIRIIAEKIKLKIAAQQRAAVDTRLAASSTPLETVQMQVARLYTALLNRAPERNGYNFWINGVLTGQTTLEAAANDILGKGEGLTIYPATLSNSDFIAAIYRNAFGADIDATALKTWSDKLAGASRARVAMELVEAVLAGTLPAPQAQRDLFNNKVAVGMTYALQMGGNDSVFARELLKKVTSTDMGLAIDSAYQPTAQLAAAAAVANAKAAVDAAKLIADAAYAAQQLTSSTQTAAAVNAQLATNPMAKPLLAAARLYVALLNRGGNGAALDVNGIVNMAVQLANGKTQEEMAQSILSSDEGRGLYASLDDTAFLTKLYWQTMNRKPDTDGLAFWMDVLTKYGRATAAAGVLNGFLDKKFLNTDPNAPDQQTSLVFFNTKVGSALTAVAGQAATTVKASTDALNAALDAQAKATAFTDATSAYNQALASAAGNAALTLVVERLYVGVLKRGSAGYPALDPDGITFWTRGMKEGATAASIAQSFIDSPNEGKAIYGTLTDPRAFVNQIYLNVLGRPLGAGDTFWTNELAKGATRGAVAAGIIDSVVNHTFQAASEYDGRTSFEQKVLDANRVLNSASTTTTAITKAATDASNAYTAWQAALTNVTNKEAALRTANALVATNDPNVVAAQQAKNFLASSQRNMLQEVLVGFNRPTTYSTVVSLVADLDAGRTTIQKIIAPWVGSLADKTAFFVNLYRTVLNREPDTDGLAFWVGGTYTDPGAAAYDFYKAGIRDELYSAASSRKTFASLVSSAQSSNASRATTLANGYNAALQTAQNSITAQQEQARRDLETARTNANITEGTYNNAYSFNEVAKLTRTTLNSIATIQDKAVTVSRAGSAKLTSADTARTLIALVDPAYVSWTSTKLSAELTPKINAGTAVSPDGQLSLALAGIASANTALMLNNADMGRADQVTRNVIKVAQLYTMLFGPARQPTTMELNSALMQLRDGVTLAALADSLIARTPALATPANSGYIDLLYRNALGRGADETGLKFWLGTMTGSAAFSRGLLASELIDSIVINSLNTDTALFHGNVSKALAAIRTTTTAEASNPNVRTYIGSLALALRDMAGRADAAAQAALTPAARYTLEQTQLYVVLLGRHPEPTALVNGIAARNAGLTLLQSVQDILASEEIQAKLASTLSNTEFITKLYEQALGRKPASAELSNALAKVAGNPVGRAQLVLDLIADTYAYTGGDALLQASRNLLTGEVNGALNAAATGMQNYATALSEDFVKALDASLLKVSQRYVEGYRPALDSTTTAAWYLDTAPDRMTVDRWGNVLTVADVRNAGWITTATYDANNQVLTTTLPPTLQNGNAVQLTTTNAYDALGQLQTVTETGSGQTRVTRYEYDSQGIVTKETRADGGYTLYDTNALGQRTASHQYLSAAKVVNFKYDYDRLGRLTARTSDETVVSGWVGSETNSATADTQRFAKIVERYSYDELGRRIATTTGIILRGTTVLSEERISSVRYDLGGNIIASSDPNGVATYRVYDALNQKWKERETTSAGFDSNLVKTREWEYDGFGRVTSHKDLSGYGTYNGYNGAGQISVSTSSAKTTKGDRFQQVTYTYETGTGLLAAMKDVDYSDIVYRDGVHQLILVDDASLNQLTKYSYDRAGNRISEQTWLLSVTSEPVRAVQNQLLGYDARGRLVSISSSVNRAAYQIAYQLDAFGNRMNVTTSFVNDLGDTKLVTVDYKYDAMNRVSNVSGNTKTTYQTPVAVSQPVRLMRQEYEEIPDEAPVFWTEFNNKAIVAHAITYDWAGNRATDNTESYRYDALGRLSEILTSGSVTGYRRYDAAGRVVASRDGADRQLNDYDESGRLIYQRTLDGTGNNQRSIVHYHYDLFGNLEKYKAWAGTATKGQETTNVYGQLGETRLLTSTTVANDGVAATKNSTMEYDVNGYMVRVTGENARTLINSRDGRVLEKYQSNVTSHTLIANGEMIGSSSAAFESFSSVHDAISSTGASASSTGVYVVQSDTEKLTTIAKAVWGDERLWYLIAEANGLMAANEPLKVGQQLILPAKASTIYNGSDTFKPYNAAEAIGSTTPEMALPQPQAPKKGGCGGLGQIIMIVVAVVATAMTGGALLAPMTGLLGSATAGAIAAGAIAGAVGSIASQAVGMAIGAQDGFNWKGVALAAIGGGVTGGVGAMANSGTLSNVFQGQDWSAVAARAALSNTVSQGVGMITGLQNKFDWRNVAASAAGAGVGAKVGDLLASNDVFAGVFGGKALDIARSTTSGFVGGTTAGIVRGGKIQLASIATDAFGNALGSSLVESMKESAANRQFIKALDKTGTPYALDDNGRPVADLNYRASFNFVQGAAQGGASLDEIVQAKSKLANGLDRLDSAPGDLSEDVLRNRTANALAAQVGTVEGRSLGLLSSDLAIGNTAYSYLENVTGSVTGPKGASIIGNTLAGGITLMTEFADFYAEHEFAATAAYKGVQAVLSGGPVKTVVLEVAKMGMESILRDATGAIANVAENQTREYVTDYARKKGWEFELTVLGQSVTVGPDQFGQAAGRMAGGVVESILGKGVDAFATRGEAIVQTVRGPYRGGPHSQTQLPRNDGLDSHHLPDRKANPNVDPSQGPAVQMDPRDHRGTSSNGQNGRAAAIYRAETADMISQGRYRDAMAREVRDVRRAAAERSGDSTKYNEAINEMLKYARSSGQLPVNPRTGK